MPIPPCQPWCTVKCITADPSQECEIRLEVDVTLDDLYNYIRERYGETFRCYTLRGNGTLKRLRRDSEFQALVIESSKNSLDKKVEIIVKQSRTLSISKRAEPTQDEPNSSVPHDVFNHSNNMARQASVSFQNYESPTPVKSKLPFKRGHRRTKSAHASYNQFKTSQYIPEPATPEFHFGHGHGNRYYGNTMGSPFLNTPGGRFVPGDGMVTPDSGFQSPDNVTRGMFNSEMTSPDTSTSNSLHYDGDLPRHLAEEHPLDSLKDISIDDSSCTSFSSDAPDFEKFVKFNKPPPLELHLPENYLVKNLIGRGGFAKVYHCIDQDSGCDLAVKQVSYDTQCNDSQRELNALKNELSILKKLSHPNIVVYYGSSFKDGYFNIFMEYVVGGSMRSYIQSNGNLTNKYAEKCLYHILLGLKYLHDENIIHRDLKAANVLKATDGTIKIADFGASKRFDTLRSITGVNTVVGTPYWMSPEVIRAQSKY